ncbi:MAG TPA: carboxypeptidase-like regulatory domain-containing protein [Bryobacteraceae bacterium]|nr:carboxypeptidase-like regulatory domain-containing protein [Bryobacteraceae bacterium]
MRFRLWLVSIAIILSGDLSGQVSRGTILGTVLDPSGNRVPGARIVARQVDTNFDRSTTTDDLGDYELVGLAVGRYTIEVEAAAFNRESRTNINLSVQSRLRVDFKLRLGSVSDTVTVEGQAPLIEGENSVRGQVIQSRTIVDLPLNGRDYLDLPLLSAGVTTGAPGNAQSNYFDKTIAANGQPADSNEYYIDGIVSTVPLDALPGPKQSPDAIQEFKVMTSTYSAEFGGKSGIHLNLISKSGTNALHGSVFEFIRNDKLDARNFFALGKPPFRRNNFGASAGGPIRKDRLFFFGAYEGTVIRQGVTRVSRIPSAAQLNGDLSSLAPLYDPFSSMPDPDRPGQRIRSPFAGNIIPTNRLDPITTKLARQFYPAPNAVDPIRNYVSALSNRTNIDIYTGKIDWRVKDNHTAFLKYSISHRPAYNPGAFPLLGGDNQLVRPQQAGMSDTWVVSPRTVAEFSVGYSRFIANFIQQNVGKDIAGEAGILGTSRDPFTFGAPIFGISDFAGFGDFGFRPNVETDNQYQGLAKVSHRRGSHSLKVGIDYRKFAWHQFTDGSFNGNFQFNGIFSTQRTSLGSNSGLADMLLGTPASASVSGGVDRVRMFSWSLYSFVTDDWQISRNLTLNFGLRWEFNHPWTEAQDRWASFNPATGNAVYPRTANTYGRTPPFPSEQADLKEVFKPRYANFAPRFGFAYRPFGSNRSAVRGGYGIYYNNPFSVDLLNVGGNFPWRLTRTVNSDPVTPQLNVRDALISGSLPPLFNLIYSHERERREGIAQQWSLGIQQELFLGLALDVSYVGAKRDHGLIYGVPFNQPSPGPGAVQPRRPYPQFNNLTAYMTNGSGSYHALQAQAEKRFSGNLSILTSYTWSRTLDDNEGFEGGRLISKYKEKGLGSMQRAHVFTSAFNYLLPIGKGQSILNRSSRAADAVLGGWQISGILTLQAGSPFNVGVAGDLAGCACTNRPNRIGDGNLPSGQRNISRWFDVSAFALAPSFVNGNAGRNILIGPGSQNLDFALFKKFAIRERSALQFRWEMFNSLNHANFGFPASTINVPATVGQIFSAATGRQMQFALKLTF